VTPALRRAAGIALLAAAVAAGCARGGAPEGPLRLGYFPNVTHAQALVGIDEGEFGRALGGRLEARMFTSGPSAVEALVAGDLDAVYVGPGPAAIAFLRTGGEALRVVAGASSGGAVLVVRDARSAADLRGKRVATPGIGNTQDVALRTWLREAGVSDRGGRDGVDVTPLAGPDILQLFRRGDLAGAWVPEPWGARLVAVGGTILVDERSLWQDGRFPAAVLAVSRRALTERRADLAALVRANAQLTRRWSEDPEGFAARANAAYARRTGAQLPEDVLRAAFSRVTPTTDPARTALEEIARRTQALGFAPPGGVSAMVDGSLLDDAAR
jgi:NitT/TauT family transport system substrate-binding protein